MYGVFCICVFCICPYVGVELAALARCRNGGASTTPAAGSSAPDRPLDGLREELERESLCLASALELSAIHSMA